MHYFTLILFMAATYGASQQKCVRILTFSDFDCHANPLFIDLKILKVHDVIKLQQLKLAYEYCNNLIPQIFIHFSTAVEVVK